MTKNDSRKERPAMDSRTVYKSVAPMRRRSIAKARRPSTSNHRIGPNLQIFKIDKCDRGKYHAFRQQQKFCDITLVSLEGARIKAHKMVLAAKMCSQFEAVIERSDEMETNMNTNTLTKVVDFCYKNEVSVPVDEHDQMVHLLKAATEYGMIELQNRCQEYLNASIDASTAAVLLRLANENGLHELATTCLDRVCGDFETIVNEPFFNDLLVADLTQILNSDKLCVPNEEFVFKSFLKWLYKTDHMELDQMLSRPLPPITEGVPELLGHIRFPMMNEEFFCDNAEQLCTLLQRTDLVVEYFKYRHLLVLVKGRAEMMMNNRMKPRPSSAKVITFGSYESESCFSAEMLKLNSTHEKWTELPEIAGSDKIGKCRNMSFTHFGKDRIVVSGGVEKNRQKQQAILFDLKERKITELPKMNVARETHASVFAGGFLYVAGGFKSKEYLNSVEKYDVVEGRWKNVQPMITKRYHFSLIEAQGRIYAIGGRHGDQYLDSVESYDPVTDIWTEENSMHVPREVAGTVVYKNQIYAIGGATVNAVGTATVERFDIANGEWTLINSLNMARGCVSCCVFNDKLIAAGGYDVHSRPMDIAEYYDEKDKKWYQLETLNKARGGSVMFVTSSCYEIDA